VLIPTWTAWPVIEEFFAMERYASAVSSTSGYEKVNEALDILES
jgi:hypothetical protein